MNKFLKGYSMLGLFKSKKKTIGATILVVDDEADLLNTIQTRLKWHKFNVLTALNGREGLEIAAEKKPDLILLDNNMPEMNGLEMLAQLRGNPELKNTPVIMITALCEPQDIAAASSFGIVDYITKPFDFADLVEKISQTLDKK
jgi:two-component system alkaline phosphatase synthesis response regulator PhoP